MGMELELIVLLLVQLTGTSLFAKFEIETPAIKKIFKWLTIDIITIGLYYKIGHYTLLLPVVMITIGTIVHFIYCRKNGIDPIKATPRKKYYQLRGWKLEDY